MKVLGGGGVSKKVDYDFLLGMVVQAGNYNTKEAEEGWTFQATLGFITSPHFKQTNKSSGF